VRKRLPKILRREQVESLLCAIYPGDGRYRKSEAAAVRNRAAAEVMYRAGLRVSEVCALAPDTVDLDEGYIFVRRGKGDKDRVVPLDDRAAEWIRRWLAVRPGDSPYLFCSLSGGRLSDRYVRQVIAQAGEKAGVWLENGEKKKLPHPHTLRHTLFTEMVEENFSIAEIGLIAGHSHLATTMVYLHARPRLLAQKIRGRK